MTFRKKVITVAYIGGRYKSVFHDSEDRKYIAIGDIVDTRIYSYDNDVVDYDHPLMVFGNKPGSISSITEAVSKYVKMEVKAHPAHD